MLCCIPRFDYLVGTAALAAAAADEYAGCACMVVCEYISCPALYESMKHALLLVFARLIWPCTFERLACLAYAVDICLQLYDAEYPVSPRCIA